jgi:RES domain-containing protein
MPSDACQSWHSRVPSLQVAGVLGQGAVSAGMQKFGADLRDQHPFVLIPSVVSPHSWNLIIDVASAKAHIGCVRDEAFGQDRRLNKAL